MKPVPIAATRIGLAAATGGTAALLFLGTHAGRGWFFSLLALAGTGYLLVVASAERVGKAVALGLSGALIVLAVALPPRSSRDLWAYAMYGRIVAVHHQNPYRAAPSEFGADPFLRRVSPAFRDTRSVYGPLFVGISAAGMKAAGDHPLAARVFFQCLAALAVLACLMIVARRSDSGVPVAALGLHPVVALSVVNGGHNDPLVGFGILAGALAAESSPVLAGIALGLAACVKAVALVPLVALAFWVVRRHGMRHGTLVASSGVAVVAIAYAAGGGTAALAPLRSASTLVARHSIARLASSVASTAAGTPARILLVASVMAGIAAAIAVARRGSAQLVAGASLVPYLLAAPYVLPWYAMWTMPALALESSTATAGTTFAVAYLLTAVYPDRVAGTALRATATTFAPVLTSIMLVSFARAAFKATRSEVAKARI